ncbi:helix-turn-helix transcriptional regulator [Devosia sp. BK]|uniref:helix-turn-helix domain-containing protein n=1 Tax=unclassified Devosia TaxID=196773 RepID=UPI0007124984|nr:MULTISPECIES: helix-turn-helix transcriptional regulator [unclassified Devosia]KQN73632.1 hypothetical protein ASE94_05055 [Devosia sp. Leaf64]MDV3252417.1 helix-turn-helix transcriptional regulator [Devosia sp. BK]
MGVQIITTPTGEEMVLMSRAEYEALLADRDDAFEDGADAAAFAAARAALRSEDILPASVSAEILAGESRLCAFRKWRGLDVTDLAVATGIDGMVLTQIEAGDRLFSRDEAARIAEALDLPMSWLAA